MRKTFLDKKVTVPPWFFLLMIVVGIFSYYGSEPLMRLMPQDKDGNIERQYSFMPVLMAEGGLGLCAFGFILASQACEKEFIKHNQQT